MIRPPYNSGLFGTRVLLSACLIAQLSNISMYVKIEYSHAAARRVDLSFVIL